MKNNKGSLNHIDNIIYIDFVSAGNSKKSDVLSVNIIKENKETNKKSGLERFYYPQSDNEANTKISETGITSDFVKEKRTGKNYPFVYQNDKQKIAEFIGKGNNLIVMSNADRKLHLLPNSVNKKNVFDINKENTDIVNVRTQSGIKQQPKLSSVAKHYGLGINNDKMNSSGYSVIVMSKLLDKTIEAKVKHDSTSQKLKTYMKDFSKSFWMKLDSYKLEGESNKDLYTNTNSYDEFQLRQQKAFNSKVATGGMNDVIKALAMSKGLNENHVAKHKDQLIDLLDPRKLNDGEKLSTFTMFAHDSNKVADAWENKFETEINKLTGNNEVDNDKQKQSTLDMSMSI
jgi:hypothetical protein